MPKGRLEAFSDAVIAIIITVMVLGLHVPSGTDLAALRPLLPVFLTYVLSYVYLGIYWNNHHHLLQATRGVSGAVLWANLHLLFWLSLFPLATGWMGENHVARLPTVVYGGVMLMAAVAYYLLQQTIVASAVGGPAVAAALGRDLKGKISPVIYVVAIALAFVSTWASVALYVLVAAMWLVPDRRLEPRAVTSAPE